MHACVEIRQAHKAGTVTGLKAEAGVPVTNGEVICELKD